MNPRSFLVAVLAVACLVACQPSADPLPSWRDGPARTAVLEFVAAVTEAGGSEFVPPSERIAVFDNDGTLWSEQPIYVQLAFIFDRVRERVADNPDWRTREPFQSVLEGDLAAALAGGEEALLELLGATHAGMTADEFSATVSEWISQASHPETGRRYTDMVYQPMLELLEYLRANDFKVFIVSGGGIEFMRAWAEAVYGIPPENIVGSSIDMRLEVRDGDPILMRDPSIEFINDEAGKPIGINRHIGRRPIAAFGNSDGDLEMLQWVTAGTGRRFGLLVHHTDTEREVAYDRGSPIGGLDQALTEAPDRGWTVVDMARDWRVIYPTISQ